MSMSMYLLIGSKKIRSKIQTKEEEKIHRVVCMMPHAMPCKDSGMPHACVLLLRGGGGN